VIYEEPAIQESSESSRQRTWLRDALLQLPLGADPAATLLPDIWLTTHPQTRWAIADRR
jgi:hypothetical protein